MADRIRWGIMGTGFIAGKFAQGLAVLPDAELVAVGSRSQDSADAFAALHNIPRRHASYEALAADPEVEAVYVATPHPFHSPNTMLALLAGKPVLCEKPLAMNARQVEAMIKMAREQKLLLMEAMWTRFLPPIVRLREMLSEGAIGELRMLTADFGFRLSSNNGRWFDPALGGGALLDVGVYLISLDSMLFGTPSQITGLAEIGPTGVDDQSAMLLRHPKGQLSALNCSLRVNTPQQADLFGTRGRIQIHPGWWNGAAMTHHLDGGGEEFLEFPFTGNGYQFEAEEFMKCLRGGRKECPIMPLGESLSIMKTMDALRAQWGLKYPGE